MELILLQIFKNFFQKIINSIYLTPISTKQAMQNNEISHIETLFPSETIKYTLSHNPNLADIFGNHYRHFRQYTHQTQDYSIKILPNGYCMPNNEMVITKNRHYLLEQTSQKKHPLEYTKNRIWSAANIVIILMRISLAIKTLFAKKIQGNVAILTRHYVEDCYGHFIRDSIAGYYQIYKFCQNKSFKIDYYILPEKTKFQKELIELLGIPKEKIISSKKQGMIQSKNLIAPTILSDYEIVDYRGFVHPRNFVWPTFIKYMYKDLLPKITTYSKPTRKIFLKRPEESNRNFSNNLEVEKIFLDFGYEIIVPDLLSIKEQILLFSEAICIASMHGSGLNNLLFSQDKIFVFEIFSEYYHDGNPQSVALIKKCHYYYMVGKTPDTSIPPQQESAYINPSVLKKSLAILEKKMEQSC